jgi:hypothetical protein
MSSVQDDTAPPRRRPPRHRPPRRPWRTTALVAGLALVAVVGAAISMAGSSGPPVIRLAGAAGPQNGTMEAADSVARSDMAIWDPVEYRFVLADTARFEAGEATAYQVRPPSDLAGAASELAGRFGLGPVTPSPWDDASFSAGSTDGTGPSLWVGPTGEWYYHAPGPEVAWTCEEPGSSGAAPETLAEDNDGGSGGGVDAVQGEAEVDLEVIEVPEGRCEAPTPPTGVPSAAEARTLAEALFATFELPGTPRILDATSDEWGAWVQATIVLGGVPSDLWVTASWGGDAELVSAGATLASVVPIAEYPTIDADAAVERLQEQVSSWWVGGGMERMVDDTMQVPSDTAVSESEPSIDEAPATDPGTEEPTEEPTDQPTEEPIDEPVVEPGDTTTPEGDLEVVTVTLVSAEPILTFHLDVDGALWLVPGYRFTDRDGGLWQVLAIDDGYVQTEEVEEEGPTPEPEPEPGIVDPPPPDDGEPAPEPDPSGEGTTEPGVIEPEPSTGEDAP